MESKAVMEINIDQPMISEEIKNKEEEKDSFKIELQQELHESILKNINDERAEENNFLKSQIEALQKEIKEERTKRDYENNFLKSQIEALQKEMEELKNGLLLLTEREDEGLISKEDTEEFWDALEKGSLPAVKFYFKENPEIIHKANENEFDFNPLHYASFNGHFDIAKFLISKKVNIDAIDSDGSTALMMASGKGHLSIMELLLDNEADVNAQDDEKSTSLHYTVIFSCLDCAKLLIQRGADLTIRNIRNETALDFAKRRNKTSIVEYLSSL